MNRKSEIINYYWKGVPPEIQQALFLPAKHSEAGIAVIKALLGHLYDNESNDSPRPTSYDLLWWIELSLSKICPLEFMSPCWINSLEEIEIILKRADELLERLGVETDAHIPLSPDILQRPTVPELRQNIAVFWAFYYGESEDCKPFRSACEELLLFTKDNISHLLSQTDVERTIRDDDPDDDVHIPGADRISPINRVQKEIFNTSAPYFDLAIVYEEYVKYVYQLWLNHVDTDLENACRLLYRNAERKLEEHINFCIFDITDELKVFAGELSSEEKEKLEERKQVMKRMAEEIGQRSHTVSELARER